MIFLILSLVILRFYKILYFFFFPLKFFILDEILHFLNNIFSIVNRHSFFLGHYISLFLTLFTFAILGYIISCLVVVGWNKFFGKRNKLYKNIVLAVFLILFFVFAILMPAVGKIDTEKNFPSVELNKERVFSGGDLKLQELTVKNNLILPVKYKLPDITVCAYDLEWKVKPMEYWTSYRDEDGNYISHSYQDTQNIFFIISLGIRKEKKIYLFNRIGMHDLDSAVFDNYKNEIDELLFFQTENVGNKKAFCQSITEEDIKKAERIKLV